MRWRRALIAMTLVQLTAAIEATVTLFLAAGDPFLIGTPSAETRVMRLRDIMTTDIKTITPSATIGEARATMKSSRIRHLLVRSGQDIVGVVSDRDFSVRAGATAQQRVADVMTGHVVTATPETTVRQAANLFRGRSIGCLPVLDDGKPVGIVTTTDLLELIGRGSERPIERSTRWTLRDRGPRRAGSTSRHSRGG